MKIQASVSGFTFTEVLSSVVIFSFGIIALTTMQTRTLKIATDNLQRSQAVWTVASIVENIKDNITGLDGSHYQTAANDATNNLASFCNSTFNNCRGSMCTASEIAQLDMFRNLCENDNMTGLRVAINCVPDCTSNADIIVNLSWNANSSIRFAQRQEITAYTKHP